MEVISEPGAFRAACAAARRREHDVALVPTMGALHAGHTSLLHRARTESTWPFLAMSIFVNPLQFGPGEDLAAYPRQLDRDLAVAEADGCDVVFAPTEDGMYPRGRPDVTVDPGPLGGRLEGRSRPGHFRGVLTVVAKLMALAGPCRAYFGEKDAQQLELVRRMVSALDLPVQVVSCPTVREPDGVAMSSRNVRLAPAERRAAPVLYRALEAGARAAGCPGARADTVRHEATTVIEAEALARLDYVAIVDDVTWEAVDVVDRACRILGAIWIGRTRLIDNLSVGGPARADVHNSGR